MKPPPPLRVELKPSRYACAAVVASHALTATLLVALPLPAAWQVATVVGVVVACVVALRRMSGRHAAASLCVGIDRAITTIALDGAARDGTVLADSYVGARLTTIVWRPDGARWPRTLLLLPDALAADDFRRLRVILRYGRVPEADPATSDVDAG